MLKHVLVRYTVFCFMLQLCSIYAEADGGLLQDQEDMDYPIVTAAYKNDLPEVKRLITQGVDVNAYHPTRWSALIQAATNGNKEMVDILLKAGAHTDGPTHQLGDMTPLMWAIIQGHKEVAQQLIHAGADLNAYLLNSRNNDKITPLHYAFDKDISYVQLLLSAGANKAHLRLLDRIVLYLMPYFKDLSGHEITNTLIEKGQIVLKATATYLCFLMLLSIRSIVSLMLLALLTLISSYITLTLSHAIGDPYAFWGFVVPYIASLLGIGCGADMLIIRNVLRYCGMIKKETLLWPWVFLSNLAVVIMIPVAVYFFMI